MYLLDTNIISEMMKPPSRRNAMVEEWLRAIPNKQIFTSAVNLAEIRYGACLTPAPRRTELIRQLEIMETQIFKDRVLSFGRGTALYYGQAAANRMKARNAKPNIDTFIASIAIEHDMVLVTRNISDFEATGVRYINPFEAGA